MRLLRFCVLFERRNKSFEVKSYKMMVRKYQLTNCSPIQIKRRISALLLVIVVINWGERTDTFAGCRSTTKLHFTPLMMIPSSQHRYTDTPPKRHMETHRRASACLSPLVQLQHRYHTETFTEGHK